MLAYTFLSFAFGQEPLTLNLIATGQIGTSVPELQIKTHQYIPEVEGDINCGGHRFKIGPTSSNQGQSLDLKLELPTGQFSCVGSLSAQFEDGGSGNMPLNFQVQQFSYAIYYLSMCICLLGTTYISVSVTYIVI